MEQRHTALPCHPVTRYPTPTMSASRPPYPAPKLQRIITLFPTRYCSASSFRMYPAHDIAPPIPQMTVRSDPPHTKKTPVGGNSGSGLSTLLKTSSCGTKNMTGNLSRSTQQVTTSIKKRKSLITAASSPKTAFTRLAPTWCNLA